MDEPFEQMTDLVARLQEDHKMTPQEIQELLQAALEALEA